MPRGAPLAEAGVRFVQCTHSYKWDHHAELEPDMESSAREMDRPIAGLLLDLAARGLLEDTVVLSGGEFGRSPTAEGTDGRGHHDAGFTMWLAGGGVRAGTSYGATDEYGFRAVEAPIRVADLHATVLHSLEPEPRGGDLVRGILA